MGKKTALCSHEVTLFITFNGKLPKVKIKSVDGEVRILRSMNFAIILATQCRKINQEKMPNNHDTKASNSIHHSGPYASFLKGQGHQGIYHTLAVFFYENQNSLMHLTTFVMGPV